MKENQNNVTIFLSGDVMTGRGVDQIMQSPSNPLLQEYYVKNAQDYVTMAIELNGQIPYPVSPEYIWGDALDLITDNKIKARIINLETSITKHDFFAQKGINYRMNPKNASCLTTAKIDCCVLANNHVLDFGQEGLIETLETLKKNNIFSSGAGLNLEQAEQPAIIPFEKGRILVFSFGLITSGISLLWAATIDKPGVNILTDFSENSLKKIKTLVENYKQENDIAILSLHWGGNWGYEISDEERKFAHTIIDQCEIDILHGHSSHHPKGIEIYQNKLILYGCGDLINDYEGIAGYEGFRGDLSFLYFPTTDSKTGRLVSLGLVPRQMKKFCLNKPSEQDANWLMSVIQRESKKLTPEIEKWLVFQ